MKQAPSRSSYSPQLSLSHWIALSSGLTAYAITLQSILLPAVIGIGAIFLQCLQPKITPRLHSLAQVTFTLIAYFLVLLPYWPGNYTDYWGLPLLSVAIVSIVAALNINSFGGSRAVTSIVLISFLLFVRNLFLYLDFHAPIREIILALAFVSMMEIALSKRYHKSEDSPHPELVFGLALAIIASFNFSSIWLAILIAGLPIIAFLLRNYELARIANEHTRDAQPIRYSHARSKQWSTSLAILPLILAILLYTIALKIPFWADYVSKQAPSFATSLADSVQQISIAADLEDEAIEAIADSVVSNRFIEEQVKKISDTLSQSEPSSEKELPTSQTTPPDYRDSPPNQNTTPENRYGYNPFKRERPARDNARQGNEERIELSQTGWEPSTNVPFLTPPRAHLESGIPNDLDLGLPSLEKDSQPPAVQESAANLPEQGFSSELIEQLTSSSDFDQFLDSFEKPGQAISQALNLEGSDVSALLSQEPLVTVKLESSRHAPRKLYLRSNVMDTVSQFGFGGSRDQEGRVPVVTADEQKVETLSFLLSSSETATVTVTSAQNRFPTLPLPESFAALQVFDVDEVNLYPEDRVVLAPLTETPVTYRLHQADLEITNRERKNSYVSKGYRDRMLEIPLSKKDRNYVTALAKRIGGSKSPPLQFAYRFANYFAARHPYSYFVDIPEGKGHPVVRWLKNESPGLCSNYAAAFTLLARSRGIPTRVVSGFASNEFDPKENRYTLRQNNAHAWVEFLNESNQWIRFDPTPGISEAEVRRSEPYTTAADPESLRKLLQAEENTLAEANPLPEDATQATQPTTQTASIQETIELKTDSIDELFEAQGTASRENAATSKSESQAPSIANRDASLRSQPDTLSSEAPNANLDKGNESEATSSHTAAEQASAAREAPPNEDQPPHLPWFLILLILAVGLPALFYAFSPRATAKASPQLQLRSWAGRLLVQLDTLLKKHELKSDPLWTATRNTLAEQRYGREANSVLIQDIAVKVGLLAKRKLDKKRVDPNSPS